jgi:N-acetylglucosaminyldiphosphoundecaprenol N-acetyl-beta-D-mannosaminyltransferase
MEPDPGLAGISVVRLLGVRIHALRLPELLDIVMHRVRSGTRTTILYVNVHCMNVAYRDPAYHRILDGADVVYCDGTGVRLAAWLARRPLPARMTGADWIDDLCRLAVRHELSLFLLGGVRGAAAEAAAALSAQHRGLRIVGVAAGYDLTRNIPGRVNAARPDILLVGMGTPRQEKWIEARRAELDVPVVWAVGALFDFVSGRIPRGPHWMTEHGLEWLCRLAVEPRKLWRRYLIGIPQFFWRILRTYWLR